MTIGMPAYNSARFVRESLLSLLCQTYPHFRIAVLDDGSNDGTSAICEELARSDERIVFRRQPHRGARSAFNALLRQAQGDYFMWAADHDLWADDYVAACVRVLEADPNLVLAFTRSQLIDADGNPLGEMQDALRVDSDSARQRYQSLIWQLSICNAIYGVMRRRELQLTRGYGPTPSPDHLVLAKMALQGKFVQLPQVKYFRRRNRPPETVAAMRQRQPEDLEPAKRARWLTLPPSEYHRRLRDDHLRAVLSSQLGGADKVLASMSTVVCFATRFGVSSPAVDALRFLARGLPRRVRARLLGKTGVEPSGVADGTAAGG